MDQQRARWRTVSGRRPSMGDAALVAALRCEDEGALREFFVRFRPSLLLAARRFRVDPGDRDALVDDCLADVAVHLMVSAAPPPRSLPAYLARSLRNRVLNERRARTRAERRLGEGLAEPTDGALAACCSEHAVRSSTGSPEASSLSPALQRLAGALEAPLTEEDRVLVVWMSHLVPHAEIAAWLGITPKAAAKRIERLRERLQRAALVHVEAARGDERDELLIFLGRAALAPGPAARFAAARGAVVPEEANA
ncbi:MAG: sigma-70 family RNA polymerase sigma factor [Gemmatimonadales bacterium]|nr:sigma-70 family RNA polymerase sigma factor [Gemmatimonadales bacterium]